MCENKPTYESTCLKKIKKNLWRVTNPMGALNKGGGYPLHLCNDRSRHATL